MVLGGRVRVCEVEGDGGEAGCVWGECGVEGMEGAGCGGCGGRAGCLQ